MNTAKTTLLVAGATGRRGGLIAGHLLDQDGAVLRLLVRESVQAEPDKARKLDELVARGASVVTGDEGDPESLDRATRGVDVVISALQGGADVIVGGQIAHTTTATPTCN